MTYDELMKSILTAQEEMLKYKIEANSVTLNGRKYGKMIGNCPPNMKPTIFGMSVKADYALPDDYDFLVQHEPPKPITNYERLICKTPEELAEWIGKVTAGGYGMCAPGHYDCTGKDSCAPCWLEWLKEEAQDG